MDKRGQTEVGLGTFLLIILGIVGLILVGMFVYNSWSKINNSVATITPEDRTVYAQACTQALNLGVAGYCDDFKEVKISGEKQYANCEYLNTVFALGIDNKNELTCDDMTAKDYCTYLIGNGEVVEKVTKMVNGKVCSTAGYDKVEAEAPVVPETK